MIEDGFFELQDGAIGELQYYYIVKREYSEEVKTDYHTKTASAYIHNLIWKRVHNPDNAPDPKDIYKIARNFSNDHIKLRESERELKTLHVQIGSKESYDFILKLEKDKNFKGWFYPEFIELFKSNYDKNTNKTK